MRSVMVVEPAMIPDPLRRLFGRLFPWYDPGEEERRRMHSELVRRRAVTARQAAEQAISAYQRERSIARRRR
jgi:hypothetical protein